MLKQIQRISLTLGAASLCILTVAGLMGILDGLTERVGSPWGPIFIGALLTCGVSLVAWVVTKVFEPTED